MKTTLKSIFVVLFFSGLASCTYVYYPTYPVVPDTKDEGTGIQATIGFTKAQLSGWHAFDSNLYVCANIAGAIDVFQGSGAAQQDYHALSSTLGVGYKIKPTPNFEFQIQGGLGAAKGFFRTNVFNDRSDKTIASTTTFDIDTRSIRGYLQPVFGFTHSRGGGFYVIPRIVYESFVYADFRHPADAQLGTKLRGKNFLLTELYGMGRINAKVINIELYFGISTNLFTYVENNNDNFVAQPFLFGMGVSKTFY
ncbi:MAG: hypothetical protein H6605_01900 [Flavobacteriales bacterium]|nr:hypothetical protein [Flavobacteriales bacterium]